MYSSIRQQTRVRLGTRLHLPRYKWRALGGYFFRSFRANAEGESESLRDRVGGFLDRLMKRSAGVAEDLAVNQTFTSE